MISFGALPKTVILQVVEKFVLQLEAQLMDRNVHIELTQRPPNGWRIKGYDDKMGARPLGRVIQEHIKKPLAEELLFGKLDQRRLGEGWRKGRQAGPDVSKATSKPASLSATSRHC